MRGTLSMASTLAPLAARRWSSSSFWVQEADQGLSGAQAPRFLVVRTAHLEDDVGIRPKLVDAVDDGAAGGRVGRVREIRRRAGAGLHGHFEAEFLQLSSDFGGRGDAFFVLEGLLGDTDFHALLR
jgi:hypothetical protein